MSLRCVQETLAAASLCTLRFGCDVDVTAWCRAKRSTTFPNRLTFDLAEAPRKWSPRECFRGDHKARPVLASPPCAREERFLRKVPRLYASCLS